MQRVALLNWKNKNKDFDLSKIFESFWTPWVSKWLDYENWYITPWFAFIEVEREWKKFVVLFENTENFPIDTNWTKKVFIEISHDKVLDWSNNNVDWTWIWAIKTASEYPTKNFIKLWRIENWIFHNEKVKISLKEDFNLTKQWNTFNQSNKLLKLDWNAKVPVGNLPAMPVNIEWNSKEENIWNLKYFLATIEWNQNRKVDMQSFLNFILNRNFVMQAIPSDNVKLSSPAERQTWHSLNYETIKQAKLYVKWKVKVKFDIRNTNNRVTVNIKINWQNLSENIDSNYRKVQYEINTERGEFLTLQLYWQPWTFVRNFEICFDYDFKPLWEIIL